MYRNDFLDFGSMYHNHGTFSVCIIITVEDQMLCKNIVEEYLLLRI